MRSSTQALSIALLLPAMMLAAAPAIAQQPVEEVQHPSAAAKLIDEIFDMDTDVAILLITTIMVLGLATILAWGTRRAISAWRDAPELTELQLHVDELEARVEALEKNEASRQETESAASSSLAT